MRRRSFRGLAAARPPADRIFFLSHWFRGHNNPRYAELLPRLHRVDAYLAMISDRRTLRGLQYRLLLRPLRPRLEPRLVRLGAKRYHGLFTTHNEQIPYFSGPIVSDVDDPRFTERDAAQLGSPQVQAYVVTEERAARAFQALGVEKPHYVIPQGVDFSSFHPEDVEAVARRWREPGDFVVGYTAAWLLAASDRGGDNPLYNAEHLLELWAEIRARVPHARLWLLGGASPAIEERARALGGVVVFGRVPREQLLAHVANFDVGLYPRTKDQGIQSVKIAEYMGAGVPTVAYDYDVTQVVATAAAGLLVDSPREFVDAVVRLAENDAARDVLAETAGVYGRSLDWTALAERYNEILDRHIPVR